MPNRRTYLFFSPLLCSLISGILADRESFSFSYFFFTFFFVAHSQHLILWPKLWPIGLASSSFSSIITIRWLVYRRHIFHVPHSEANFGHHQSIPFHFFSMDNIKQIFCRVTILEGGGGLTMMMICFVLNLRLIWACCCATR